MPIDTKHRDYAASEAVWSRCRDIVAGEDRVKERAEEAGYLPRLSGQSDQEYKGYLGRAMFHNATARTIQAVVGAIFRKPLVIDPQPVIEGSDKSRSITNVARGVVTEIATTGRVGIFVDVPQGGGLPYMLVYRAEDIINWRVEMRGDDEKLMLVVLRESEDAQSRDDPYATDTTERFRELYIDKDTGNYSVRLWRKHTNKSTSKAEYVPEQIIVPTALGSAMQEIPFSIVGGGKVEAGVQKPPLLDLINVNLSHFRTSADLEHGRHFTALPTPWVAGFDAKTELRIGSGIAWVSDNPQARAGFLEFSGAGLASLQTAMEQKEHLMSVLGARLFEPSRAGVESAEALRIRQSADTASAAGFADVAGLALTKAYRWMLSFVRNAGGRDATNIEVNKDIIDVKMDPAQIMSLVGAWQQGGISFDTMLYNLKQGEIIPMERSIEDEKSLIRLDDERFARGDFKLDQGTPG